MPCKVITEAGDEIPLDGDLVNGGVAADAFVASQRAVLKLPEKPLHGVRDAAAIATIKTQRIVASEALAGELLDARKPIAPVVADDLED